MGGRAPRGFPDNAIDEAVASGSGGGGGLALGPPTRDPENNRAGGGGGSGGRNGTFNGNSSTTFAIAKFSYAPQREDELALTKVRRQCQGRMWMGKAREGTMLQGCTVRILDKSADGWWKGSLEGATGWFPSNYVVQQVRNTPFPLFPNSQRPLSFFATLCQAGVASISRFS